MSDITPPLRFQYLAIDSPSHFQVTADASWELYDVLIRDESIPTQLKKTYIYIFRRPEGGTPMT